MRPPCATFVSCRSWSSWWWYSPPSAAFKALGGSKHDVACVLAFLAIFYRFDSHPISIDHHASNASSCILSAHLLLPEDVGQPSDLATGAHRLGHDRRGRHALAVRRHAPCCRRLWHRPWPRGGGLSVLEERLHGHRGGLRQVGPTPMVRRRPVDP